MTLFFEIIVSLVSIFIFWILGELAYKKIKYTQKKLKHFMILEALIWIVLVLAFGFIAFSVSPRFSLLDYGFFLFLFLILFTFPRWALVIKDTDPYLIDREKRPLGWSVGIFGKIFLILIFTIIILILYIGKK